MTSVCAGICNLSTDVFSFLSFSLLRNLASARATIFYENYVYEKAKVIRRITLT